MALGTLAMGLVSEQLLPILMVGWFVRIVIQQKNTEAWSITHVAYESPVRTELLIKGQVKYGL